MNQHELEDQLGKDFERFNKVLKFEKEMIKSLRDFKIELINTTTDDDWVETFWSKLPTVPQLEQMSREKKKSAIFAYLYGQAPEEVFK